MAILRNANFFIIYAFQLLLLVQILQVYCYQYKVGDLDAWGIPTSSNPKVYYFWSKYHNLSIGDSLLFLYPPSQDSVIQVTEQSFNSCNLTDPILYMNDGNSLFNITKPGQYFFTSGVPGHCEKKQKLQISVLSGNGSSVAYSPSSMPDASAPSYPTVFGSMPLPLSSSSSKTSTFSILVSAFLAVAAVSVRIM